MCVHVCFCVCVCACAHVWCTYTYPYTCILVNTAEGRRVSCPIILHLTPLWLVSLNLELYWQPENPGDPLVSTPYSTGVTGTCGHTQFLMWVPGSQAQVLMLTIQALLVIEPPLQTIFSCSLCVLQSPSWSETLFFLMTHASLSWLTILNCCTAWQKDYRIPILVSVRVVFLLSRVSLYHSI